DRVRDPRGIAAGDSADAAAVWHSRGTAQGPAAVEARRSLTTMPQLTRRSLLSFGFVDRDSPDHWIRVHRTAVACRFEVLLASADAADIEAARAALAEADAIESFEYPGGITGTFSSVESNAFNERYECFFDTKGTLIIRNENDAMLFDEGN